MCLAEHLLGSHVNRSSGDLLRPEVLWVFAEREAEVGYVWPTLLVDQYVRRFDITVHQACLVCVVYGLGDRNHQLHELGRSELVCLEITTQAGVTGTSLMPELVAYAGITFDELVRWMVADASTRR